MSVLHYFLLGSDTLLLVDLCRCSGGTCQRHLHSRRASRSTKCCVIYVTDGQQFAPYSNTNFTLGLFSYLEDGSSSCFRNVGHMIRGIIAQK